MLRSSLPDVSSGVSINLHTSIVEGVYLYISFSPKREDIPLFGEKEI